MQTTDIFPRSGWISSFRPDQSRLLLSKSPDNSTAQKLLYGAKYLKSKQNGAMHVNVLLYHSSEESHEELLPSECYEKAFSKMTKLTHSLKNVDLMDGRLVNTDDFSTIIDDGVKHKVHTFKSLLRTFLGSPAVQEALKKNVEAAFEAGKCRPLGCFSKPSEREPRTVNSLTKACNFLNISAQQRNFVRFTICPQVTQHRIWMGALEEILSELNTEMDSLNRQASSKGIKIGQQIVFS